jgi:peptidoglycan hydrolase-like protein with peptidoglycan-binding domain
MSGDTTIYSRYKFYVPLTFGSRGEEVMELQKSLSEQGVFSSPISGYYGEATLAAMKRYQSAHGLTSLGNLGSGARE